MKRKLCRLTDKGFLDDVRGHINIVDLEGEALKTYLRENLVTLVMGSDDPDIAKGSAENYISNLEANKLGDFKKRMILSIENPSTIGLLIGMYEEDRFYITTLAVHTEFRQQGYGTELLEFCRKEANKAGMKYLVLDVHSNNKPAWHLYQKLGFHKID